MKGNILSILPPFLILIAFFTTPLSAQTAVGSDPVATPVAAPETQPSESQNIASMSLEELLNVKVTLVTKTAQNFFEAPAAVYVVTQDEIGRSGATTLA